MFLFFLTACMVENNLTHMYDPKNGGVDEDEMLLSVDALSEAEEEEEESFSATNEYSASTCEATQTVVWNVEFPPTVGCEWNQNENAYERESFFQARTEQSQSYPLDFGQEICDVRFEFSSEFGGMDFYFHYDDHVLFTFNDRIVFNSFKSLNDRFATDEYGYYFYDWLDMRSSFMGFYVDPYGVGTGVSMNFHATKIFFQNHKKVPLSGGGVLRFSIRR